MIGARPDRNQAVQREPDGSAIPEGRRRWLDFTAGSLPIWLVGLLACIALAAGVGSPEQRSGLLLAALSAAGVLADRLSSGHAPGDALDCVLRSACLALAIPLLVAGVVFLAPGAVDALWLIGGLACTISALAAVCIGRPARAWRISRRTLLHLLILLSLGAPLRLVMLGYSELQGDEAQVMNRAAAMFAGVDAAALVHRKGPGELLLELFWGGVVGRVAESDARLPIALASVLGVLAVYAAGRALFTPQAGLIAGTLWAINGYAIAFGRVVQYHSLVVLFALTALVCAANAMRSTERGRSSWYLAACFLIAALACGFNAPVLGFPAGLMLLAGARERLRMSWRRLLMTLLIVLLVIAAAIALLAVLAPGTFREWARYGGGRIDRGQPFNNLDTFIAVSISYASLPYLGVCLVAPALALGWIILRTGSGRWLRVALVVGVYAGASALVITRGQPTWLALAVYAGLLAGSLALPGGATAPMRLLALSVLIPLGTYLFLIGHPGTHWYEVFPALCLLVGGAWTLLPALTPARRTLATAFAFFAVFVVVYPTVTIMPGWPSEPPLPFAEIYRPTVGKPRGGGRFGFPHNAGWKTVAALYQRGDLTGPLQSNQGAEVLRWYLPEVESCDRAVYYALSPHADPPARMPEGYLAWIIRNEGPMVLVIYQREGERRAFQQVGGPDDARWYDANRSTLARPLTPPQRVCGPAAPSWNLRRL